MENACIYEKRAVRDYFDRAALTWDEREKTTAAQLNSILCVACPPEHARILDIACGTGIMIAPMLELKPALLRAIDISPAMVQRAKLKFPNHSALRITTEDFYAFEETGFGFAMVYNAYPHFIDKARFAARLKSCLAPGGRFVIAHGAGRGRINACHTQRQAQPVSTRLLSCKKEAARLGRAFCFDIMIDTPELYILSGIKPNK